MNVPTADEEDLILSDQCTYTATFAAASQCAITANIDNTPANEGNDVPGSGKFGVGESTSLSVGNAGTDLLFGQEVQIWVTNQCAASSTHTIYKNVPIADRDAFALTTFTFIVTPSASPASPATCTSASVDITGDGSPAVTLTAVLADSVLTGNAIVNCLYDITEVPFDGWTNQIPLFGTTQFNQDPAGCVPPTDGSPLPQCSITPFRNVLDPVPINVTKSMDLDDFVVLSNIDTGLLNERIDFFISATDGCANSIIDVFNGQLGSTGTFVNTSPAQVELAGFNDNVFTGEDVPVVVDGEPCTYTVEELADEDLLEYCAPVNGDTQSLTWTPGLTSFDFTFHNDCEAPAEPEPTETPTGTPTETPDVDDGGTSGGGGPSFAG